ncbi:hypothetical protein EYF80_031664 [Liparis tanakae]|uniref:Uncharacterized protein n=1 Tax=Liparis tanakae TaxID=230148 RepID=A0A4Z2GXV4_9TELE|nr:hypothetical protein EYF80_031664 [Liparis tanakae]
MAAHAVVCGPRAGGQRPPGGRDPRKEHGLRPALSYRGRKDTRHHSLVLATLIDYKHRDLCIACVTEENDIAEVEKGIGSMKQTEKFIPSVARTQTMMSGVTVSVDTANAANAANATLPVLCGLVERCFGGVGEQSMARMALRILRSRTWRSQAG